MGRQNEAMILSIKTNRILSALTFGLVMSVALVRPTSAQQAPTDLTVLDSQSNSDINTRPRNQTASDILPDDQAPSNPATLDDVFPEELNPPGEAEGLADGQNAESDNSSDNRRQNSSRANGQENGQPLSGQNGRLNPLPQRDNTIRQNPRERRADQVGIIGPDGSITPLANSRQPAVQGGTPRSTDDPFAALGLRVGSFTLFPVLTQYIGGTTNADASADGESSAFTQTDLRLTGVSNWSRHQLRGQIGGNYEYFFNGTSDDLPNLDADLELRLDLSEDWTARLGTTLDVTTESVTSDNLTVTGPLTVEERPLLGVFSGYAEIDRQAGNLNTRLRGTITRARYGDAELSDGSDLSQSDRNNNLYQLTGRIGYDLSPSFTPFVEGSVGFREHDETLDRNGVARDSDVYALRAGFTFDRGEKLNGEIAIGYASEDFDDDSLATLDGVTVDGTINWSPVRFTTITSTVQTQFSDSTNVGESGSITYAGTIGITREIYDNFSVNAQALASLRDYQGSGQEDRTWQIQAGAEWRLSRMAAILGNIGYENVDSTDPGSTYDAVTARVGIRLQR